MRVLLLTTYPQIRGPLPKLASALAATLSSLGYDVATEPWGRHRDAESLADKLLGRARDVLRIRAALLRHRAEAMLVTTTHDATALARDVPLLLATRRLCPRIILRFHGGGPDRLTGPGHGLLKAASRLALRLSDAVLLDSSEEQRQWQRFYPTGHFHLVRIPYVRLPVPAADAASSLRRWPDGRLVLLFVGRLIEPKGILDLLDALPRVLARADCHLLVAGDGALAARARERVAELGLSDRVTLAGYLRGGELAAAYQVADVFVLPTWHGEGFPTVIVEALDAGLPIVTTRIRGAADHLTAGEHALFVPPRDPAALAEALVSLLSDRERRRQMAQRNQQKVEEFLAEAVGEGYVAALGAPTRPGDGRPAVRARSSAQDSTPGSAGR